MPTGFLLNSKYNLEIDVTPEAETEDWARLAKGITSMEPDPNEETSQDNYYDGDGYAETDVIGAQLICSFSGHRYFGDKAQDYIYSKVLEIGPARRTDYRMTMPDGASFEGPCTIAAITGPGGDAGAKGEISFEIHFAGRPTYEPAPAETTTTT
ncbi:capsid protein [Oceanobacillus picturae]|uniref:Capsid protein n=1 Tax=Oceanobacillus picturae TaxID=171693 RepID=A0A0U9H5W5_9BACI|nr:hypothetical protein [Oceanobacillus picturae]GAQ18035.1 capsid protein [Oceanobacillus picturae]